MTEIITKLDYVDILDCINEKKKKLLCTFIKDNDIYFDLERLLSLEKKIISIMVKL
jgi:hypothetical protein